MIMNLSDKFGELSAAFSWKLNKEPDDMFSVTIWTRSKIGDEPVCSFKTDLYDNLHKAVDEAILLFKQHTSDCSLC